MKQDVSDIVEVPMVIPERVEGEGVCAGGIRGGIESGVMVDRAKRVKSFRGRLDFRECIPCDRCGNCLEIRRFTKKGEDRVLALYCLIGEMEVTPYTTCNNARRSRNGRKKVVYYLENAPAHFKVSAERVKAEVPYVAPGMGPKLEETIPEQGYVGGSAYYRRKDGDGDEKGQGEMPRGLVN